MLAQFREKVSGNIDVGDVMAHYDLGTAYMEMGLLDEAISEFQVVLRGTSDHLPTYEMLGQTFLQKEEPDAALRSLIRGLDAPCEVEEERVGIYYYIGLAHETSGDKDTALSFYDRVFALDINFADITERLRDLRS
jgi:pilus assembly protein FimV